MPPEIEVVAHSMGIGDQKVTIYNAGPGEIRDVWIRAYSHESEMLDEHGPVSSILEGDTYGFVRTAASGEWSATSTPKFATLFVCSFDDSDGAHWLSETPPGKTQPA